MPHLSKDRPGSTVVASSRSEEDASDRGQRILTKNRRIRYLQLHPEYLDEPSLELADPLLYDRMVRRFLSVQEREEESRSKGYSGALEANLVRSEAKLEALRHPDSNSPMVYTRAEDGSITGVEEDAEERPRTKDEGWEKWKEVMGFRFVRGGDKDFDYDTVDANDEYDDNDELDRKKLEEYLDGEEETLDGTARLEGQTGVQDY